MRALVLLLLASCSVPEYQFGDALPLQNEPVGKTCANGGVCIDSASLSADSNDDGNLNPGETATITIYARNGLNRAASNLYARLTDVPDGVAVHDCSSSYAQCAGACACSAGGFGTDLDAGERGALPLLTFDVTLASDAAIGSLPLGIDLFDDAGESWHDDFTLAVTSSKSKLVVADARIDDDSNGDGVLSPGDTVSITVSAKNTGTSSVVGAYAKLTDVPTSALISDCFSYVAQCTDQCNCSPLGSQSIGSGQTTSQGLLSFTLQLKTGTALGPLDLGVTFFDQAGNSWTDTIALQVEATSAQLEIAQSSFSDATTGSATLLAGRTGTVDVYARNTGNSAATVVPKLSSIPAGVTVSECFSWYASCSGTCACTGLSTQGKIAAGQQPAQPILSFDVAASASAQRPFKFSVSFSDNAGNTWVDDFSL